MLSKSHDLFHLRAAVRREAAQNGIFLAGDSLFLGTPPWASAQRQTSRRPPAITEHTGLLYNITDTNLSLAGQEGIS